MKKTLITAAMVAWCGVCAHADDATKMNTNASPAASSPSAGAPGSTDSTDRMIGMAGKFGVGVTIGEPIGASLKYFFNDTMAVDGALGWSTHENTDLYIHSDVLWHNFILIPVSQGQLPLYFGVGRLVRFRNNGDDNQVGIRVPVGLSYLFDNAPVDVFAEIGPALAWRQMFVAKSPAASVSDFGFKH